MKLNFGRRLLAFRIADGPQSSGGTLSAQIGVWQFVRSSQTSNPLASAKFVWAKTVAHSIAWRRFAPRRFAPLRSAALRST